MFIFNRAGSTKQYAQLSLGQRERETMLLFLYILMNILKDENMDVSCKTM